MNKFLSSTWINNKSFTCIFYVHKFFYQLVMTAFFPILVTLVECVIPVTFLVLKGSSCVVSCHCQQKVYFIVGRRQYYFHKMHMVINCPKILCTDCAFNYIYIVTRVNSGKTHVHYSTIIICKALA